MKQKQYSPYSVPQLVVTLYAIDRGLFDSIDVAKVLAVEADLQEHIQMKHQALIDKLAKEPQLSKEIDGLLAAAIGERLNSAA